MTLFAVTWFRLSINMNIPRVTVEASPRIALWPAIAHWNLTDKCNLECPYCLSSCSPRLDHTLTTDECLSIVDILCTEGVTSISLMGGEPLTHPGFFDVLSAIGKRGAFADIITNGLLLKGATLQRFISMKAYILGVQISLHLRDRMDDYARLVSALSEEGIRAFTLLVVTREDLPRLSSWYEMMARNGASAFFMTHVAQRGRASDGSFGDQTVSVSKLAQIILELRKIQLKNNYDTYATFRDRGMVSHYLNSRYGLRVSSHKCEAAISEFQMNSDGACVPCPYIDDHEVSKYTTPSLLSLGSLQRVWQSPEFNRFRDDTMTRSATNIRDYCFGCEHHQAGRCRPCRLRPSTCQETLRNIVRTLERQSGPKDAVDTLVVQ